MPTLTPRWILQYWGTEVCRRAFHDDIWIAALENIKTPLAINSMWKNTDHFWCSAFVSFVYYKLGWILEVNWTIISPREFSGESSEGRSEGVSEGRITFVCEISDEDLLN
jgi:hypothetical protein